MRIALAASGFLGANLFAAATQARHEIVAVLRNGRRNSGPFGWFDRLAETTFGDPSSVEAMARRRSLPIFSIDKMTDEELAPLRALRPDLVLVGGFSVIFKEPLLALPRIGCVNVHSSLLPLHRGPNPYCAVLLSNDSETGVTFHVMDMGIDTGDIIAQYALPIAPADTAGAIYNRTALLAAEHVGGVLTAIEKHGLVGRKQDSSKATYDKRMFPSDAVVDWKRPASDIERLIRAYYPSSTSPCFRFRGATVFLTGAQCDEKTADAPPGKVLEIAPRVSVATGRGILRITRAFSKGPIPWTWPSLWSRPRLGEIIG